MKKLLNYLMHFLDQIFEYIILLNKVHENIPGLDFKLGFFLQWDEVQNQYLKKI